MMWSSNSLSVALSLPIDVNITANEVQFNSLDVKPFDIFIALNTGRDGHPYVADAINRGAACAICSYYPQDVSKDKVILVEDTLKALYDLSSYKRNNSKAKFIGVTGSVGKTTTKELIKHILLNFGKVFASRANFNNYIGLPLNIASMPDDIDYGVFELGMNKSSEISLLSKILKPDIALITNVSEAHLAFFDSVEGIADAKSEIFEYLGENGVGIVNLDNKYYNRIVQNFENYKASNDIITQNSKNIYTFGVSEFADSRLVNYETKYANIGNKEINPNEPKLRSYTEMTFSVNEKNINNSAKVEIANEAGKANDSNLSNNLKNNMHHIKIHNTQTIITESHAKNIAAALAVVANLNLNVRDAVVFLNKNDFLPIEGRGKILELSKANKEYLIICDYYNSSPASLDAAIDYLSTFKHSKYSKKIAIVGDMLELGVSSCILHQNALNKLLKTDITTLVVVGAMMNIALCDITKAINNVNQAGVFKNILGEKIEILKFKDIDHLLSEFGNILTNNEVILIKGSRGIKLDRLISYFD